MCKRLINASMFLLMFITFQLYSQSKTNVLLKLSSKDVDSITVKNITDSIEAALSKRIVTSKDGSATHIIKGTIIKKANKYTFKIQLVDLKTGEILSNNINDINNPKGLFDGKVLSQIANKIVSHLNLSAIGTISKSNLPSDSIK